MSTRRRLNPDASRAAALAAARDLLVEAGPAAVTVKAVATRIGQSHANLLHHFGSAAGLQQALAGYLAESVRASIVAAVLASRASAAGPRSVVDLVFDAFDAGGGGALAGWVLLTGNDEALDPVVESVHRVVGELASELCPDEPLPIRRSTLLLVLLALGNSLLGPRLAGALHLDPGAARDLAETALRDLFALGVAPSAPGAP